MNFPYFIAKRLQTNTDYQGEKKQTVRPMVRISIVGIALGLAVMIVAVGVVTGFKHEVESKVIGFGAHIQVGTLNNNNTYETPPISFSEGLKDSLRQIPGMDKVQVFVTKPAIFKTEDNFMGMVLKGLDAAADTTFFANNLVEGRLPCLHKDSSNTEVIISMKTAKMLQLETGSSVLCYFIDDNTRVRKLHITGIYNTGLQEFDQLFAICRMDMLQQLSRWEADEVSGLECMVKDFDEVDKLSYEVFLATANRFERHGETYYTRSIRELEPQLFGWLALLNTNVIVILLLMLAVSGFTIVSGLLILILDRTNFIGIMKALGAPNKTIRQLFLYQAGFLILKGLFWGDITGISLCLLQNYLKLIPLDASVYFVDYVPVLLNGWMLLGLNLLAGISALLVLLVPSRIIANINPAESIRFE